METQLDPANLEAFVGLIVKAAASGHWAAVAILALIAVVFFVRKFLGPKFPVLQTGAGGAALNIAASILAGLALKVLGGVPFTWALVGAVTLASLSAGWFSLANALLPSLFPTKSDVTPLPAAAPVKAATSDEIVNGQ